MNISQTHSMNECDYKLKNKGKRKFKQGSSFLSQDNQVLFVKENKLLTYDFLTGKVKTKLVLNSTKAINLHKLDENHFLLDYYLSNDSEVSILTLSKFSRKIIKFTGENKIKHNSGIVTLGSSIEEPEVIAVKFDENVVIYEKGESGIYRESKYTVSYDNETTSEMVKLSPYSFLESFLSNSIRIYTLSNGVITTKNYRFKGKDYLEQPSFFLLNSEELASWGEYSKLKYDGERAGGQLTIYRYPPPTEGNFLGELQRIEDIYKPVVIDDTYFAATSSEYSEIQIWRKFNQFGYYQAFSFQTLLIDPDIILLPPLKSEKKVMLKFLNTILKEVPQVLVEEVINFF